MDKLLRLYGRNLLHHFGAMVGAVVPYVIQLTVGHLGWRDATALSSGIVVSWLFGNTLVSSKLAGTIATDLGGLAGKNPSGLLAELEPLLGGLFGAAGGASNGPMAPPAGMEGVVPGPVHTTGPGETAQVPPGSTITDPSGNVTVLAPGAAASTTAANPPGA